MARVARVLLLALAAFLAAAPARAQRRDAGAEGDLLDEHADDTPREEDPISMGAADEVVVPDLPPDAGVPTSAPAAPAVPSARGAVLAAIPGVRETSHTMHVTLASGLARVDEELAFTSSARTRAEVEETLALPPGARLVALSACDARGCRTADASGDAALRAYDDALRARPVAAPPLPVARATLAGETLHVAAAPVVPGGVLRVRVTWVARAPMHGGVVRFSVPPRGQDARTVPLAVTVSAGALLAASVDGVAAGPAVEVEPWAPVELAATLPTGAPLALALERRGTQLLATASAGPPVLAPRDLVLVVDASPSTEGPARGRLLPAMLALLADAPSGSRVRVVAFAARTEDVLAEPAPVERVETATLANAVGLDLGHATRLDVVVARVAPWLRAHEPGARPPLLVLLGDGGIADDATTDDALAQLRRLRAPLSVVNVSDAPTGAPLARVAEASGGTVVDAGLEADRAARGQDDAPLLSRVAAVLAPPVAQGVRLRGGPALPLRAGEELFVEAPVHGAASLDAAGAHAAAREASGPAADWLAAADVTSLAAVDARDVALATPMPATCDRTGPAFRASGQSSDAFPVALAEPRCVPPPTHLRPPPARPLDGQGVPAETVRAMVRDRLVPAARACFRADRHGRAQYSVRAVLAFALRDRELVAEDVGGELGAPLRACLMDALDRLDVPRFAGTVLVRYPLRTESEPPPEVVDLGDAAAQRLDDVIGRRVEERDVRRMIAGTGE